MRMSWYTGTSTHKAVYSSQNLCLIPHRDADYTHRQDASLGPEMWQWQWWSWGPAADLFNVIHLFGTICRKDKRWVLSHHHIILNPYSETAKLLWCVSVVLRNVNAWRREMGCVWPVTVTRSMFTSVTVPSTDGSSVHLPQSGRN